MANLKYTRECNFCNNKFIPKRINSFFCLKSCSDKYYRQKRIERNINESNLCKYDNCKEGVHLKEFCRIHYYRSMYKPRPMKIANCLQCEKKFKGVGQKIFCSINCGSTYKRRKKNVQPAKRIKEAICKECKKEFKPRKSENCIFCSRECSLTYQKRNGNRKGKKLISFDVYSDKRKKLIKQNGNFERINKLKVFERDNWKCHICNCKTPKEKKGTFDDNAPEMDHIVPLAAGGSHNYANVACSCRKCNGKKGKKPLGQLLFNL